MRRLTRRQNLGLAGIALGVVLLGGWASWRAHASAAAPERLLAGIPAPAAPSATDAAVTRWSEQARRTPTAPQVWVQLGDALMQKARETADAAYYTHAERAYRQSLSLDQRNPGATGGMAWVCGGRHEFEQSIDWSRKRLALDSRSEDAYGLMGDADVEMGNYDAAFDHYQKMLDLRPALSSYSRGAHLLYLCGNVRKATWLMAKAIAAGGPYAENTAWCRAQLALMLLGEGGVPAAEQVLKTGLSTLPHNYQLLAAMGRVQAAKKDYRAAIDDYQQAVAVVPQHDSLVALGDLYQQLGRREDAERQYALVEALHRVNRANGVRGDAQIARFYADHDRNLPQALQEAEEEYRARKNVFAADTLAWCYYKNGRLAAAREMIRKALARKTPEAAFSFHAGMIYEKLGERGTAQRYLYEALSLNPNFSILDPPVASQTLQRLGSVPPEPAHVASR